METNIKAYSKMIKCMVLALTKVKMEVAVWVIGKMVESMVFSHKKILMVKQNSPNGIWARN